MQARLKWIFYVILMIYPIMGLAINQALSLSDQAVAHIIIEKSIADYIANHKRCPCPYYVNSDGALCGANSAWSEPAKVKPMCYIKDVPASVIEIYRMSIEAQ